MLSLLASMLFTTSAAAGAGGPHPPQVAANPEAVRQVLAGQRPVANAAWWGFDAEDATEVLQAAIDSGARKVVVPRMGGDWIVRPLRLAGDQELVLEEGVVVTAKRGEFRGRGDSLFTAQDVANLTLRGRGATLRMQKEDYIVGLVLKDFGWNRWFGQYEKAEWRMALALRGCAHVRVEGLTLRDSGGDGIYIDGGEQRPRCENILIREVVCDNNYRQGISIISVDGLRVEDSVFRNTWGTPPSSGVDIEPDSPQQQVTNVVFRNCRFEDNYGDGIEVFLAHQTHESADISLLFDRCRVRSRRGAGIRVSKVMDNGPGGLIEFRDCVVENTVGYGIKVQDKSALGASVRFVRCTVKDTANDRGFADTWTPILLAHSSPEQIRQWGGIEFTDCVVEDDHDRPAVTLMLRGEGVAVREVAGTITVRNPHGAKADLGRAAEGVRLLLKEERGWPRLRQGGPTGDD